MVLAKRAGRKTQTRRVFKQATGLSLSVDCEDGIAELSWLHGDGPGYDVHETIERVPCPYGVPGDRLWTREAWRSGKLTDPFPPREMTPHVVWYEADGPAPEATNGKLRPGMFMPRWACRSVDEVTEVRVQLLKNISEADCIAEGCAGGHGAIPGYVYSATPSEHYRHVWESINGPGSWDENPYVWCVSFRSV